MKNVYVVEVLFGRNLDDDRLRGSGICRIFDDAMDACEYAADYSQYDTAASLFHVLAEHGDCKTLIESLTIGEFSFDDCWMSISEHVLCEKKRRIDDEQETA